MRIDYPQPEQLDQLRLLWQEAFGDTDDYLDGFFYNVFSPDRCRCVTADGQIAAALYWLDCRANDRPIAYLYAIATAKARRGKGLCRGLMADTHALLQELGYAGCILVPGEKGLFRMYQGMGYTTCSGIREFTCKAGDSALPLRRIHREEYAALRRQYLPDGGVIQENENLTLLTQQAELYAGADLLLCAAKDGSRLICPELLGNADAAPAVLTALGAASGTFRTPGNDRDFAMYHPLADGPAPAYFGLAFD